MSERNPPDRPMYVARVGADDVVDFLAILPPEEAARVRARAWHLHLVEPDDRGGDGFPQS